MQHQQQNRLRSYQSPNERLDSRTHSSEGISGEELGQDEAENDNVLLFGGATHVVTRPETKEGRTLDLSLDTLSSSQSTTTPSEEWTVLPLFALPPRSVATTSSNNSTTSHSNSTSNSSNNNNPRAAEDLSHSLFPSHDGDGIFVMDLEDSLTMDDGGDEGSIYASISFGSTNRRHGSGSNTTSESRTTDSTTSSSSNNHLRSGSSRRAATATTRSARRRLHFPQSSHRLLSSPPFSKLELEEFDDTDSIGSSSWALTEAHLSSLPQDFSGSTPIANAGVQYRKMASIAIDANQMKREGEVGGKNWKGKERQIQETRYDEMEDEDEEIKIGFNRASRYPTPPSELTMTKRRHRESGRESGSQKRSSNSGSCQGSTSLALPTNTTVNNRNETEAVNNKDEKRLFLGRLVGSLMEVDGETLNLLATTPTQTRVNSPIPSSSASATTPTRKMRQHRAVGDSLSRFAREEMGELDSEMFDLDEEEEDEESGNETETEGGTMTRNNRKGAVSEWYKEYRPIHSTTHYSSPLFSPSTTKSSTSSQELKTRSHSLSSLSLYYLFDNDSDQSEELSSLFGSKYSGRRRRTNSFTSGSNSGTVLSGAGGDMSNNSGVDSIGGAEGLEYAISYWRRILQRMKWVS